MRRLVGQGDSIPMQSQTLAANGLRFTQCYNTARCCPSRARPAARVHAEPAPEWKKP
jgi:hypothetical protein